MENKSPSPRIAQRELGDLRSLSALMQILADFTQLEILTRLLMGPATQKELRQELQLPSGPVSRKMAELERSGFVSRDRSHGPYDLRFPEDVLRVFHAVSDLHLRQVESYAEAAQRSLQRARGTQTGVELEGEEPA